MKFIVKEQVLNEYVSHPTEVQVDVIEAKTFEEARKIAMMRYPNRGPFSIVAFDRPTKPVDHLRG